MSCLKVRGSERFVLKLHLIIATAFVFASLVSVGPAAAAPPSCVTVYDFPDAGLRYCVDADADCKVREERITFLGTESRCIVGPAGGADQAAADVACVQYAYVADYHWYWVCVDPKDKSCAVSLKEQHGMTVTRQCLPGNVQTGSWTAGACVPTSGGMDYHSFVCVNASDPKCALYTLSSTDAGVQKRCVPGGLLS